MKRRLLFLVAMLLPLSLLGLEGTPIGGEPYEKWEEGARDYFVMFNSLVDDQATLYGETTSRMGDTCLEQSSFTLDSLYLPDDAVVAKAYLVWMSAVDPAKFDEPTDNAAHLKFAHQYGHYVHEEDIIAGDTPKMLGDTSDPFLFQSVRFESENLRTGCSETEEGTTAPGEVAFFTYRADITSFFTKIRDDNLADENWLLLGGEALYGDYTVSDLDCTGHDFYRCNGTMVSNWSILVVYNSEKISGKRIYLYHGFAFMQGEASVVHVSGFELSRDPVVHLTAVTAEGDAGLVRPTLPSEVIYIRGPAAMTTYALANECNLYAYDTVSYEVYNSDSSVYGWSPEEVAPTCVTGTAGGPVYLGIDADTFLLDPEDDVYLQEHLKLGDTYLDVTFSVNQDAILANYLVFAEDWKAELMFDIPVEATDWPEGREKHFCSCRQEWTSLSGICSDRPFYYLIKVQNWGVRTAHDIVVKDDFGKYPYVDYVPGTTEMATQFDEKGNGTDWTTIPDGPNGEFPLAGEGYKVADTMTPCDQTTWTCVDTRLVRFKVMPKPNLPKCSVIPNIARIKEGESSSEYLTNSGRELNLLQGECKPITECPEPPKSQCGGGEDIVFPDEDLLDAADLLTDDTDDILSDADTKKDGGCGCSMVW